jgi:hypothetical protein
MVFHTCSEEDSHERGHSRFSGAGSSSGDARSAEPAVEVDEHGDCTDGSFAGSDWSGTFGSVDTPVMRARTVEAQEFLVKDADGRVRARLSLYPNGQEVKVDGKVYHMRPEKVMPGQASLQFYDENGEEVWVAPKVATVEQLK